VKVKKYSARDGPEVMMSYRAITVLLLSSFLWGQAASPQQAATQRMQAMAQQLQLTEQQKEKVMPILVEEAPKISAVKSDTSLPQNQKLAKLMQIRNDTDDQIRPLLTSAQQQKLDQIRQQQRQQMLKELTAK
jgi:GTPase Era involved in 16S rRNA processing